MEAHAYATSHDSIENENLMRNEVKENRGQMKKYKLVKDLPAFKAGTECYIEEAGHMVPCRGISYTIVHKDQLEKNPNILTDWFEEIKESARWEPEIHQCYYHAMGSGGVLDDVWNNHDTDRERFEMGNCFQTEEEAERAVEYLKALAVVRGDATSKFIKSEDNWYVYYDTNLGSLMLGVSYSMLGNGIFGLPYFDRIEDAKRSIELHEKEWLTIFGFEDNETQE